MSKLRIVLANGSLAKYPQGGGHWSVFLQYLSGLNALGHDVFWLELFKTTGDNSRDQKLIRTFLTRFLHYGFGTRCALLLVHTDYADATLDMAETYGASKCQIQEQIRRADLLWNFCGTLRQPFLSLFRRRALIDLDPGMLQIPALDTDLGLSDHEILLTAGSKMGEADCQVPTLGVPGIALCRLSIFRFGKWHPTQGNRRLSAPSRNGLGMRFGMESEC